MQRKASISAIQDIKIIEKPLASALSSSDYAKEGAAAMAPITQDIKITKKSAAEPLIISASEVANKLFILEKDLGSADAFTLAHLELNDRLKS